MCFSATASFSASAALFVAGSFALFQTRSRPLRLLAAIPLLFALQQFTEGLVWLSLTHPDYAPWHSPAVHAFLFFAQVLWPAWLPVAVYLPEKNTGRKKILLALALFGIGVSLYFAYRLIFFPVAAPIQSHHIRYQQNFPFTRLAFAGLFYFIPTVLPLFLSTTRRLWLMGLAIFASYIVTHLFYAEALVSVWCYFAALISLLILFILHSPSPKKLIIDNY